MLDIVVADAFTGRRYSELGLSHRSRCVRKWLPLVRIPRMSPRTHCTCWALFPMRHGCMNACVVLLWHARWHFAHAAVCLQCERLGRQVAGVDGGGGRQADLAVWPTLHKARLSQTSHGSGTCPCLLVHRCGVECPPHNAAQSLIGWAPLLQNKKSIFLFDRALLGKGSIETEDVVLEPSEITGVCWVRVLPSVEG